LPQIIVENLVKTFQVAEREPGMWGAVKGLFSRKTREVRALDGISFSIEPGELVGYIGPNGAGKSTTVKLLSGIMVPESGSATVLGRIPWKHRVETVREIGVIFGQRTQLWWDLPVTESFRLLRDIYRVPAAEHDRTLAELDSILGLSPLLATPVRQLSLGQRMRCELAGSLLHSPRILFLDEPTIGLDPDVKLSVRDFILRLNHEKGVTMVLTSHDMDDVTALCRRVMVLAEGKILMDGTVDDIRARVSRERRLVVDLADPDLDVADPDARIVSRDRHRVTLSFDPEQVPAATLIARITARYPVRDLTVSDMPIEEVVARLFRGLPR
jgi:ABC-2 type transport system ATP-binding protein